MSARSRWGWGTEAGALPLGPVRAQAGALFGELLERPGPRPPRVPPPAVELPPQWAPFATQADEARAARAWGKSWCDRVRAFEGDFSAAPDVVAWPRTEAEVERVLEVAGREGLAVTPFGGGTSVVGGVEPRRGPGHRGTVSLDLGALQGLLELDEVSLLARLGAGTLGPALEAALGAHGLTLRHFPQSFEFSTLGGWIATRAAGHFATGPTHIDELVQAARMVTPRGVWATHRVPASGAGPEPLRLLLGSEGTLGVITEAWVRVRRRPRFRGAASVHFADFSLGAQAARAIVQAGLQPANARLLDGAEAWLNGVASDGASVLVLGFESADGPVAAPLQRALELAAEAGGRCPQGPALREGEGGEGAGDAGDRWRASFLKGPYLQDALLRLGVLADTFETACTWRAFPQLYAAVKEELQAALEPWGGGLVSCRLTHLYPDGPAPYFTFVVRVRPGAEREQWGALKATAAELVLREGGTITHHHAVGRVHRPWHERATPPPFAAALRAAKRELDPQGLLNPGVLMTADPA
jgi:alkyldihydroxyacetonephosphate synthase